MQLARDCYVKAADLYKKNKSLFHAAKALENVMILCKEHATDNQVSIIKINMTSVIFLTSITYYICLYLYNNANTGKNLVITCVT